LGNVPLTATISQCPFVEIAAEPAEPTGVGVGAGTVGFGAGVVRAGEVGVGAGVTGVTTVGVGAVTAGVVAGDGIVTVCFDAAGCDGTAGAAEGVVAAGVAEASCWTNGSLDLKRLKETSWPEPGWTVTMSVSDSWPSAAAGAACAAAVAVGATPRIEGGIVLS
jgi:hypothetical protein